MSYEALDSNYPHPFAAKAASQMSTLGMTPLPKNSPLSTIQDRVNEARQNVMDCNAVLRDTMQRVDPLDHHRPNDTATVSPPDAPRPETPYGSLPSIQSQLDELEDAVRALRRIAQHVAAL